MTPDDVFAREYHGGRNFMTPNIGDRGWIQHDHIAYEVSTGTGIYDEPTWWGVTIVEWNGETTRRRIDLSKLCYSQTEAWSYIGKLKEQFRDDRSTRIAGDPEDM